MFPLHERKTEWLKSTTFTALHLKEDKIKREMEDTKDSSYKKKPLGAFLFNLPDTY